MSEVDIPAETLALATEHAKANGATVRDWLVRAINNEAAAQQPVIEIPVDDGGFYSPLRTHAVV
jgi:hypothetical protein